MLLPSSRFAWCFVFFWAGTATVFAQTVPPPEGASPEDDVVILPTLVVGGIAEGQAAAIAAQRDADSIRNIVTSDAIGRLPDFSVGEALGRLPGVSVQKDRGEPEFITIRGAAPRLNLVALNGERLPSVADPTEERNDRSVTLNAVPTALISGIEVAKAVTPDMDADAVGGAVNLSTRSPLDLSNRVLDAKVEWGYNDLEGGDLYSANITFGDRFGAEKNFGILLGASYQYNNRHIHEYNINYGDVTLFGVTPTTTFRGIQEFDSRYRFLDRERTGINGQLDWEFSKGHRFYVRGFYNEFSDAEERIRFRNRFKSDGRYLAGSQTNPDIILVDGNRFTRQDRQGSKETTTSQLALGGKHTWENTVVDYSFAVTEAEFQVDRVVVNWENRLTDTPAQRDGVVDVRLDATNFDFPEITYLTASPRDFSRFVIRSGRGDFTDQHDFSTDADTNGQVNFRQVFELGRQEVTLKTGYRFRLKETETVPQVFRYTRNSTASTLALSSYLNADESRSIFDRYAVGPTTNFGAVRPLYFDNVANWTFDTAGDLTNNRLNTYTGSEDIHALYAMASTDFGGLRVIGGVRWEQTETEYSAFRRRRGDTGNAVDAVTGGTSYDSFFPGLLATWHLSKNLLIRAAWTNTIARPDYKDLAPFVDADIQTDALPLADIVMRVGNPDLEPFESMNYDASIEYYYQRTGFVSAGFFYKDITNFEFDAFTDVTGTTAPDELGPVAGATSYRVRRTQPINGPSATLQGLELALSHKFSQLPGFFRHFGVIANATFVSGESELPAGGVRTTLDLLPGQVESIYNFQLYWENDSFAARVAWNYNSEYLEEIGTDAVRDIYVDESETLDLSFEWNFVGAHKFYIEVKNVTDEYSERKYQGVASKPTLLEEAGRTLLVGAKLSF